MLAVALSFVVAAASGPELTCDAKAIERDSYRLTTEAQALNVTAERSSWWAASGSASTRPTWTT